MADRVYIHSAAALGPFGDYLPEHRQELRGDAEGAALKPLVKQIVGQPLRQASHFIELASIGARLCLEKLGMPAPPGTAVYLGTGLADVRKTEAVFRQVVQENGLISPFDFINAANNMAAFYVARLAGFASRNLTLMQNELSVECALRLAFADLRHTDICSALVGGVDEVTHPRSAHLQRLPLDVNQLMGEGSGWLYLTKDARGARGELLAIETIGQDLASIVEAHRRHGEPVRLLPGFRLAANEVASFTENIAGIDVQDYVRYCGCYYSAAAFGIATSFDASKPALYLHINRDETGRQMAVLWRVFES